MQIIVFVLILSVLVLIHELGHYMAAKFFKMRVDEFGIGLPPRAKGLFTKWGTLFSLNWIPLGGFVKLYGEDPDDEIQAKDSQAFFNKPIPQRAAVLLAGVFMNFLLGVLAFGAVYTYLGIPTKTDKVFVVEVAKDSPAELASIKAKEEILGFANVDDFVKKIDGLKGTNVKLEVKDEKGVIRTVEVMPRVNPPAGQGGLGVALSNIEMKMYPIWERPFRGVWVGLQEAWAWGKEIAGGLGTVLWGIVTGKGLPKDMAGPVGIYQVSKQAYTMGVIAVVQFMAILSINLAILNVMPFPALDGGRLFFLIVEMVIGKRLKNKFEGYVHTAGMALLLLLMAVVTVRDIIKLF
jgi:regulator of sigma E protease